MEGRSSPQGQAHARAAETLQESADHMVRTRSALAADADRQEALAPPGENGAGSDTTRVRRGPRSVHTPVCARARETIRTIRSTRRNTCHLACTCDAVDARCHVSAALLAVSETAGAEACIIGSMISDLRELDRGILNALLAPPGSGSLLRIPL